MKMAELIGVFPGALASSKPVYPSYVWYNSELPLVAEFLARNDGRQLLFNHIRDAQVSPGIAIMLIELADMVAFNNEIFSQAECSSLEKALDSLRRKAVHLADSAIAPPERWKQLRENYKTAAQFVARHCDEIMELIRQAQFIRVRSVLKDEINLEINQDKYVVQGFLTKLGFSEPLIASLNEAERLNHSTASPFELKSSMGHLRSFMEHLHSESIPTICASKKVSSPEAKWGNLLFFLRENDVISKAEEHFLSGLFVLISDEAVHPIIAEREYARLARNMVIEYAVLFLRRLDKLGYSGRAAITQLP
jgi:hypothetical protein